MATDITGRTTPDDRSWAKKAGEKASSNVAGVNKDSGTHLFATRADYLQAQSTAGSPGKAPEWLTISLTPLIAEDAQRAINQIKDAADQVIAVAKFGQGVAQTLARVLKANSSIVEALINTLRDEIKSILDQLISEGAVYGIYIPPDDFRGGIAAFKKKFDDSLKDTADPRRPQIADTTYAHAIFMVAGAPGLDPIFQGFEELRKKMLPGASTSFTSARSDAIPPPEDFSVKAIFGAAFKPPIISDTLTSFSPNGTFLRRIEDAISLTERASKLQGHCSWKIPDSFEIPAKPNHVAETVFDGGVYKDTRYYKRSSDVGAVEIIREDTIITRWVIARSNSSEDLNAITTDHKAVKQAIETGDTQEGANFGLGNTTRLFVGRVLPGLNFYSDTSIAAVDSKEAAAILNAQGDNTDGDKAMKGKGLAYHYKALFVGVRKKYIRKFVYKETVPKTNIFGMDIGSDTIYTQYKSNTDAGAKTPLNPYDGDSGTVELTNFDDIRANQFLFDGCDPIYEGVIVGNKRVVTSDWSAVKDATNESILVPGGGTPPDWYAGRMIDFAPPLKSLIELAKAFVDNVADSLIEGIAALADLVKAVLDKIDQWLGDLVKLMEIIKSMLFPPMAGIHYLALSSPKGMKGLKQDFERSFQGAPLSVTGEKDFPDEFLRYGSKVSLGEKILDVGNKNGHALSNHGSDGLTEDEIKANNALFTKGEDKHTRLSTLKDKRGRLKGEPSDEDLRKLSIPMYDENHFVGGFVFVFESNTSLLAFTRILNLRSFLLDEGTKARRQLVGQKEFNSVKFPSLKYKAAGRRTESQASRIAAAKRSGLAKRVSPNDAQLEALIAKTGASSGAGGAGSSGADGSSGGSGSPGGASATSGKLSNSPLTTADGSQLLIATGSEPYVVTANEAPLVITLTVNGLQVVVVFGEGSYSAKAASEKLNSAVRDALVKAYGIDPRLLTDLFSAADGKLVSKTPVAVFGDRSGKLRIKGGGGTGGNLAGALAGDLTATDPKDGETADGERPFPVKDGQLLLELQDFGMPEVDEILAMPAIYEMGEFITDPEVQDFGPDLCHLRLIVDQFGEQVIDVTGDLGGHPSDRVPRVTLPTRAFPFVLDSFNDQLRIQVYGDYRIAVGTVDVVGRPYERTLTKSGVDFFALGVRPGDKVSVTLGAQSYQDRVIHVFGSTIELSSLMPFAYDQNGDAPGLTIAYVEKSDVPGFLSTPGVPRWDKTLYLRGAQALDAGALTVSTPVELAALVRLALVEAGADAGAFTISGVTVSTGPTLTGYVGIELNGDWAIGEANRLKLLPTTLVGRVPQITIVANLLTTAFPLLVSPSDAKLRLKLTGGDRSGGPANTPALLGEWVELALTPGFYVTADALAGEAEFKAHAAGFPDFVIFDKDIGTGNVFATIDTGGATRHWAMTQHVGLSVSGLGTAPPDTTLDLLPAGVGRPPAFFLSTAGISFPFTVASSYGGKFKLAVTDKTGGPGGTGRVVGPTEIAVTPGVYASRAAFAAGVASALVRAGYGGYVHVEADTTAGGGIPHLAFYTSPEAIFLGPLASVSLSDGRVGAALAPAGAFVSWPAARDFDYAKVFSWMAANGDKPSPVGFPSPTPLFDYSYTTPSTYVPANSVVYSGSWTVTAGVNDSFEMQLETPIGGLATGWQTVTLVPGGYSLMATLVDSLQASVDSVYGVGVITVSARAEAGGHGLGFTVVRTDLWGDHTILSTRQKGSLAFFSYGSQTGGHLFQTSAGYGDKRLFDLLTSQGGVGRGASALVGGEVSGVGTDTHDYLFGVGTEAIGSKKVPYTLKEIVTAINTHLTQVSPNFFRVAEDYLESGRLRLTGSKLGSQGRLRVVNLDDKAAGGAESAKVAALIFGLEEKQAETVDVRGLGRAPRVASLEVVVVDVSDGVSTEAADLAVVLVGDSLLSVVLGDELTVEVPELEKELGGEGYLVEVAEA